MEKSIKGTRTEQNLLKSFAGESQARMRYQLFAKQAKKDGYEQIAALFEETANEEKRHATEFFRLLEGGAVEITATYPAGKVGTTAENLLSAAEGEYEEWAELYSEFAKIAQEEGFPNVATKFKLISTVEKRHEERYRKLLKNVETQQVFKRPETQKWHCRECGYVHEGPGAPEKCPLCAHPMAHYELLAENF
ncbi:MAG: rubrerythrin family protein [Prevotellaceae bacterium]|jgi:rubrerythrin|nr:rubrerythrin family protein [Prevotellaceae bacterium]